MGCETYGMWDVRHMMWDVRHMMWDVRHMGCGM